MIRTTLLIGYKTLSEFAGKLFFFLIIIWAARNLSKEEFGIVSLAWALGWITSIATDFGLQIFLTRQISRCPSQAPIILKRLLRIRISLCGVLLLGGGAVMVFADWGRFSAPFLLIVGAQIVGSLIDFFSHFYRGLSRAEIEASINLVYRGLTLTLVLLLSRTLSPLLAVSYAMIVGAATGLAITWFLAFRLSRRISVEAIDSRDGLLGISTADLFRTIAPIGAGILLSALYFRMDLFLIEYWKGSEAVAVYNAVFRLIEALRLFPAAVLAVVFPYLCRSRNLRPLAATGMGLAVTGLLAQSFLRGELRAGPGSLSHPPLGRSAALPQLCPHPPVDWLGTTAGLCLALWRIPGHESAPELGTHSQLGNSRGCLVNPRNRALSGGRLHPRADVRGTFTKPQRAAPTFLEGRCLLTPRECCRMTSWPF